MSINNGDSVTLDYEGRLEDGEIFDSSKHGDHSHPLTFKVGLGEVIKGFERAVLGMAVGEEKEFEIEPKDAYGEKNPKLKKEILRSMLPKEAEIKIGTRLILKSADGRAIPVEISDFNENTIKLDFNHPLAGKKLIFKIKIIKVN